MPIKSKKPTLPTPKDLKAFHAGVITFGQPDRLMALRQVGQWYMNTLPFRRRLFDVSREKAFGRGVSSFELGVRTDTPPHEAENSLMFSIRLFEKAYADAKLPKIADTIARYELKKALLQKKFEADNKRYESVLNPMNETFGETGITFAVHQHPKARLAGADRVIRFNHEYVADLITRLKIEGLAATLLREVPSVLRALSVKRDAATGAAYLDPAELNAQLNVVLERVADRVAKAKAPAPVAKAPVVQATRPVSTQPKALFRPGSHLETLYIRLQGCGGTISIQDLLEGIQSGDPNALVSDLISKGKKTGVFTLTRDRNKIDLHFQEN